MSLKRFRPPAPTPKTRLAARLCLEKLATEDMQQTCLAASPYGAIQAIARSLMRHETTKGNVWVVQASPGRATAQERLAGGVPEVSGNFSAWPLWFRNGPEHFETPLLYLLRTDSIAGMRALTYEAADRGILCNDAESVSSRWPKSVQPALPLWLASNLNGIPYDPASGQEALAILRSAMQIMYVDDEPGFFYMSLHDDGVGIPASAQAEVHEAYKGMYRCLAAPESVSPAIRLLGAGQTLGNVLQAADLLREDWGITCEVWSCPSYTRLAREGHEAEHWNMLHPSSRKKTAHIHTCLGTGHAPVLAITGYGQHIADQIGAFVPARFVAMGADSHPGVSRYPSSQWIVVAALKMLGDEGVLSTRQAESALTRYALI